MLFPIWVSRIPAAQERHGLSHGELGLALLAMALGAVLSMPLAGGWVARWGSKQVSNAAAPVYCAALAVLFLAPNVPLFIAALFCFGAFHGGLDVSMNSQAVEVEKLMGRPVMSSFHALFSAGGLAGAAAGAWFTRQGMIPPILLGLVSALLGGAVALVAPRLLTAELPGDVVTGRNGARRSRGFPLPSGKLAALGVIALCVMTGEGAMADWSGVHLHDKLRLTESRAALGYAVFSAAMTIGRLSGDWLIGRIGRVTLARASGLLATCGLAVSLLTAHPLLAIFGFACVGAGFATVIPMVFSAAGNTSDTDPGVAVAVVTTMGYLGFLAGPPLIGLVAELTSLRSALWIIVASSATAAVLASHLRGARRSIRKSRQRSKPRSR